MTKLQKTEDQEHWFDRGHKAGYREGVIDTRVAVLIKVVWGMIAAGISGAVYFIAKFFEKIPQSGG